LFAFEKWLILLFLFFLKNLLDWRIENGSVYKTIIDMREGKKEEYFWKNEEQIPFVIRNINEDEIRPYV
jgi:hypothetical protein